MANEESQTMRASGNFAQASGFQSETAESADLINESQKITKSMMQQSQNAYQEQANEPIVVAM